MDAALPDESPRLAKRKRLLKACQPCHRSKRRCDGFAPCQNCVFAGKRCMYTDPSGRETAPPNPEAQTTLLSAYNASSKSNIIPSSSSSSSPTDSTITNRPQNVLPPLSSLYHDNPPVYARNEGIKYSINPLVTQFNLEPRVLCDLVDIYFAQMHPYNTMIHRPSFLYQLGLGQVPPYLLAGMLSLAAPYSPHPLSKTGLYRVAPRETEMAWRAGVQFAQYAVDELFDSKGALRYSPEERIGQELELAQTLLLLALHGAASRLPGHDSYKYFSLGTDILVALGVPEWDVGQSLSDVAPGAGNEFKVAWRRRESCRRTLWIVHYINMLATAFSSTPVRYKELDVRLYLPIDDGVFDLTIPGEDVPPQYLTIPRDAGNDQMYISEFGHLYRVTSIYSQMLGFVAECNPYRVRELDSSSLSRWQKSFDSVIQSHESAVESWEASLPLRLRLNDQNLRLHGASLECGVHGSWAIFYMHALAKCGLLALYSVSSGVTEAPVARQRMFRKEKFYDELINLLKRYGEKGRRSIFTSTLLVHVGAFRAMNPQQESPSRQHDSVVDHFFAEYERTWGVNSDELLNVDFRELWVNPILISPLPSSTPPPIESRRSPGKGASPPSTRNSTAPVVGVGVAITHPTPSAQGG